MDLSFSVLVKRFKNKELFISAATVAVSLLLQFIFIRYASYGIEKNDYGNYVLLQTLLAGLTAILLQIPGQAFDRFFNSSTDKKKYLNEFRTLLIIINIISIFLIIVYGLVINKFSFELLLIVFLSFVLINNFTFNQKIFLSSLERTKYFYLRFAESIAKFIIPIISYLIYHSLESLFIGLMCGYAMSYILTLIFLREYQFKVELNLINYKKYFHFAYPILFVSAFTWGISFSDRYFIDFYLNTKYVAIYSLLAVVAGVGQIIGQIYFLYVEPKILKDYELDNYKTYRNIKKYLKNLIYIFSGLTLLAIFMPRPIYTLLLKKEVIYNEYFFMTMIILLIAIFINVFHTAHHMYLKLLKRLDLLAYIYFIALSANLMGNYLFIPKYGIIAAAISTLGAYLIILLLQIMAVKKFAWQLIDNRKN